MQALKESADSPLWDDVSTQNTYIYPLEITRRVARKEGRRLAKGRPPGTIYRHGPFVCDASPESHIGPYKWAIDFLVPDGTPVIVACDGVVTSVQEDSASWGDGPEYANFLNYVTVRHGNGEFSQYCHLAQYSVSQSSVEVGLEVTCGQQIALTGKTGWTDRDHLHFLVFKHAMIEGWGFKSLRPKFKRTWLW